MYFLAELVFLISNNAKSVYITAKKILILEIRTAKIK